MKHTAAFIIAIAACMGLMPGVEAQSQFETQTSMQPSTQAQSTTSMQATTQPDAVYKLIRRSWKQMPDGSIEIRYRKELTLYRNRAITAYADKGETFIEYNPAFEELVINECYTIRPDGSKVQTPANAFVQQLPSGCADCGRYNGIREMAIVHTGLEYNCTIVLDYTLKRKSGLLSERFNLQMDCPVERYELDYPGIPDSMRLHTNLPQTVNEPYMKPRTGCDVEFQLGEIPQYRAEAGLPEAQNLLRSLKKEDDLQTVTAIRDWVVDHVTQNKVNLARVAYRMTPAAEVFRSNCGTGLDKLGLLAALLNETGYEACILNESRKVFGDEPLALKVRINDKDYQIPHTNKKPIMQSLKDMSSLNCIQGSPIFVSPFNVTAANPVICKENSISLDTLPGGYFHYTLPKMELEKHFSAAKLTPTRISNVFIGEALRHGEPSMQYACQYEIRCPGKLHLVGGNKKLAYSLPGIGNIKVAIRKKGKFLYAYKELVIIPSEITPEHYAGFRQLIIDWESSSELMFK